jgi:hypothetical protein
MKSKFLASVFVLAITAAFSQGATLVYTNQTAQIPVADGSFISGSIALPQFDSSYGTLNSISFRFRSELLGSNSVENLDASPALLVVSEDSTNVFSVPTLASVSTITPTLAQPANLAAYDGNTDYTGASGAILTGGAFNTATYSVPLVDFAPYIGVGTFDVDFTGATVGSVLGGGTFASILDMLLQNSAEVTYDYTVVPEPASALALLGVVGTTLARRKRRA